MHKAHGKLWSQIEQALEFRVPSTARKFFELQGWIRDWENAEDERDRAECVANLIQICVDMKSAGLIAEAPVKNEGIPQDEIQEPLDDDGRWRLLRDLYDDPDYRPIRISRGEAIVDFKIGEQALDHRYNLVRIDFDSRIALNRLLLALRKAWPEMKRLGWVVPSRPLEKKTLALIRHVCLESDPGTPWGKICSAWNEKYPDWAYRSGQALSADFHRAEKALTKEPHGLEGHYNPWATASLREIKGAAQAGDQRARSYIERRFNLWDLDFEKLAAVADSKERVEDNG